MAPRGQTRAKVLQTARELFARQGYHGTGLNQILAASGAPKGGLYFHFPGGKQQLAAEAVLMGAGELAEVIDTVLVGANSPRAAIEALAELLCARLEHSDFLDGCPVATVALDSSDSTTVRQACCSGYERWLASISDYLSRQGLASQRAGELAVFALSTLEGALLLAQTQHDSSVVRQVADRLAGVIEQEVDA